MAPYLATQQARGLPSNPTTTWDAYRRVGLRIFLLWFTATVALQQD